MNNFEHIVCRAATAKLGQDRFRFGLGFRGIDLEVYSYRIVTKEKGRNGIKQFSVLRSKSATVFVDFLSRPNHDDHLVWSCLMDSRKTWPTTASVLGLILSSES